MINISKSKFTAGFSLVELLLVIGIVAVIFAVSAPYTITFYRSQILNDTQSNIIEAMQRARHYALLQKNDSNFGVYISTTTNAFTLYQGNSYDEEGRDSTYDENYDLLSTISIFGPTEINFSKFSGSPNATGTVSLILDNLSRIISVDDFGVITR